jgi:hypothetical protein
MSRRSFQFTASLAVVVACAFPLAIARAQIKQAKNPNEFRAQYLFNFAKYTEWPKEAFPSTNSPFVLGILGKDPFGKDIDIINGQPIKNRVLLVKYFKTVQEVNGCQVLYICPSEKNGLPGTLKALENSSVLTIAEMDGFIQHRGMINMVVEGKEPGPQTIGFEINQAAAEQARLKIDSQLLKLAKVVRK